MFKKPSKEELNRKLSDCNASIDRLELRLKNWLTKEGTINEKFFNDKKLNMEYKLSGLKGQNEMLSRMSSGLFDFNPEMVTKTYNLLTKKFMQADRKHSEFRDVKNIEEAERHIKASCYERGQRHVLFEFGYDYKLEK